ncbi:MAG: hypothetical protein HWQ38_27685 [Nostoc sp. NMS7]|uniref:hypothetical protein n=1 Tax=Nostoc sp. NMS7 TaxID=2815391 RepID=UPI0025CDBB0A|nr:hypothetical protein [Nostoc sp. NMS7]MBN3950047.1 hypothetical protein [Nostoc sp. NMS7]
MTQCEFWDLPLFSNADITAIAHPSALIWRLACCSQPSKYEGQILFIPFFDCHWRSQVKIKSIDLRERSQVKIKSIDLRERSLF